MRRAEHDQVVELGISAQLPGRNVVTMAPGNGSTASRVRAPAVPGGHRPAQPVRDGAGDAADIEGLARTVHDDGDDGGIAAQHAQRLRRHRAAEIEAGGPGPVLQIFESYQHVEVRAVSAALRDVAVVEHVAAHLGQRLSLPRPGRPVVVAGQRSGLRVDHRGDRVEHRGVVEPAPELPATAGQLGQEQLVGLRGRPVVGFGAVLIQQLDQRRAPVLQLRRRVQLGLRGELLLRARPGRR